MNKIQTVKTELTKSRKSKKGFTLVELVVVIAILAILAAIAIPIVSNTIESSNKSSAKTDCQTVELALKEAHAMIEANDTSAGYTVSTTVLKVLQDKKISSIPNKKTISGKEYILSWSTSAQKCKYINSNKDLDGNAATGYSALDMSKTVVAMFPATTTPTPTTP